LKAYYSAGTWRKTMRISRNHVLGATALTLALTTTVAGDDTVKIKSGTIVVTIAGFDELIADLDLEGTKGFSLAVRSEGVQLTRCPCNPGQTFSLAVPVSGSFSGTGTIKGRSYRFTLSAGSGLLQITAPSITLPPLPPEPGDVAIEAPFTAAGILVFQTSEEDPNPIAVELNGSGLVTAVFTTLIGQFPLDDFEMKSITYEFDRSR
jgi:hypothetical protein